MKVGKVVNITQFRGVNNVNDPSSIDYNTMVEGTNVYLSAKRRIRRRKGQIQRIAGLMHSAFATADEKTMVMVKDNNLVLVNANLSTTLLRAGMLAGMPVSFSEINGVIYYSNGVQLGRIENRVHGSWGIANPPALSLQSVSGILQAGIYGAVISYLRANGAESGTSSPVAIEITANSGIQLTFPVSSDPEVVGKVVYITQPDGAEPYQVGVFSNSATSMVWQGVTTDIRPSTMFMGPPPAGQALGYLSGRCLIASGDILYYTSPFSYELVDYSRNYKQLPDWIDILAPVEDGAYLSYGDNIAFMKGREIDTAELVVLAPYGSTPGTLAYVNSVGGVEAPGKKVAMWSTERGVVAGYDGGQLFNISENSYRPGRYRGGGALYLQRDGDQVFIATHRGSPVVTGNTRSPTGIDVEIRGPL